MYLYIYIYIKLFDDKEISEAVEEWNENPYLLNIVYDHICTGRAGGRCDPAEFSGMFCCLTIRRYQRAGQMIAVGIIHQRDRR